MHTPPAQPSPLARHALWGQPPQAQATPPGGQGYQPVAEIIDGYASSPAVEAPKRKERGKRRQRTPSPLPGLHIPKHKRRKAAYVAPQEPAASPSPAPAMRMPEPPPARPSPQPPAPLPEQQVPPYYVDGSAAPPMAHYHQRDMPPLMGVPQGPPVFVPMPQYGFLHELPQAMAPHSFTPMFTTPNGRFQYYVFADDDGRSKVALIGHVDEMQELYRDLACRYPGVSPHAYGALLARIGTAAPSAHGPAAPAE